MLAQIDSSIVQLLGEETIKNMDASCAFAAHFTDGAIAALFLS
jgi:hypothetical protein